LVRWLVCCGANQPEVRNQGFPLRVHRLGRAKPWFLLRRLVLGAPSPSRRSAVEQSEVPDAQDMIYNGFTEGKQWQPLDSEIKRKTMRSEQEMLDLIVNTARDDDRIRAVIMN